MASPVCPEYEIFRTNFDTLRTGIAASANAVADKAFSRAIITSETLDEVISQGSSHGKARKLLQAIGDQIQTNPRSLETFIQILREEPAHSHLADCLVLPTGQATASAGEAGLDHPAFGERPIMHQLQHIKWRKQGKEEHLKVIEQIQDSWNELGTTFGILQSVLNSYRKQHLGDDKACCREVLHRWLQGGSKPREAYPVTWKGLIKALEDTDKGEVAGMLKEALPRKTN